MDRDSQPEKPMHPDILVRPLREPDLAAADQGTRLAFGTFLGAPDPASFFGDAGYVRTRWRANPNAAFAAEADGQVIGSNFATNWGSVGFFGPLTVRPDFWDSGVGTRLMEPVMTCFEQWRTKHAGLFTFAQSPKHIGLYQKFGFYPRFLTAIMGKPVEQGASSGQWTRFSDAPATERPVILAAARRVADALYEGLDLAAEILAVADLSLGDTVLLWDNSRLVGFAICHSGSGTEAGSGVCYVKFGAVEPGTHAHQHFGRLLASCEALAVALGAQRLTAGINTACREAYGVMQAQGFRTGFLGVAMHKPDEAGYHHQDAYVIDDWR